MINSNQQRSSFQYSKVWDTSQVPCRYLQESKTQRIFLNQNSIKLLVGSRVHAQQPSSSYDYIEKEVKIYREYKDELPKPMRLAKALAFVGVASRRDCAQIIKDGRVRVNGDIIDTPAFNVDVSFDQIHVDGSIILKDQFRNKYYFALYKPRGYLCSTQADIPDKVNTRLVLDLMKPWLSAWKAKRPQGIMAPRLMTVGRIDYDSSGLIFVTNDGDWANRITHPSNGLTKEYLVQLDRPIEEKDMRVMMQGVYVMGGLVQPVYVGWAVPRHRNPDMKRLIRIVVTDGRKHEVRIICETAGFHCERLKRVRIGAFRLPRVMKAGEFKQLKFTMAQQVLNPVLQDQAMEKLW